MPFSIRDENKGEEFDEFAVLLFLRGSLLSKLSTLSLPLNKSTGFFFSIRFDENL